jgi:glycerophosphoryl diester phosphodiesterase
MMDSAKFMNRSGEFRLKGLDTMKAIKFFSLAVLLASAVLFGCCRKERGRLLAFAHRGASSLAPENTLSAVKKAVELGAEGCEIDVRLTKDGQVVLLHDARLERTVGVTGAIWDYTLGDLAGFEAGSWFGEQFKGEPIPTLTEVIRAVKGKILLNIEIKVSREETALAQKVVEIIHREKIRKKCLVTSFDRTTVEAVKAIDPRVMTGFIFGQNYPQDVFEGNWDVLSCNSKVVDDDFVARARERKKKIHVWTVDDKEEMKRQIGLGVDAIITNRPQDLILLVRK